MDIHSRDSARLRGMGMFHSNGTGKLMKDLGLRKENLGKEDLHRRSCG